MLRFPRSLGLLLAAALFAAAPVSDIAPAVETDSAPVDVDDPAIWVNPQDPARSLIVGTVKQPKPNGGLLVYSLDGSIVERIPDLDRPNNVDILGDLCVVTERLARQLRVYRVHAEAPHLRLIGTVPVFEGEAGELGAPMGIALYQRKKDRALFAVVSRKQGPSGSYLWQYRLHIAGDSVRGEKVRAFGAFSGAAEIEAVAVDGDRELIYYSDENCCVRVYRADPDRKDAANEVARFAETGFEGNREGIAIAGRYILVTDQLNPRSEYHVFDRRTRKEIAVWRGMSESTDGLDAIARPMGPRFPRGFLVAMNNAKRNFHIYRWP
jgi:3-phytase